MNRLSKDEIAFWAGKYDKEELQYNNEFAKEFSQKLWKLGEFGKDDLIQLFRWKFQGRLAGRAKAMINKVSKLHDDEIRIKVKAALSSISDEERIKGLMGKYGGIKQVGLSMASVILTFYDPKNYAIYDIHAWRELFGTEPKNMFSQYSNLKFFLNGMREIARENSLDTRTVEKAYFKKNYDDSKKS